MTTRSVTHATFTLERLYPASPKRVFAALTDPKLKPKWFNGPEEWGRDKYEMDFRVGGRESSVGGPKGGPVHSYEARFYDIVPDERLIYAYDMHLDDVRISVSLASMELKPEGGATRFTLTEDGAYLDGFDNGDERKHGTGELLDALGRFLAQS